MLKKRANALLTFVFVLAAVTSLQAQSTFSEQLRSKENSRINLSIDPLQFLNHGTYFGFDIALNERTSLYYGRLGIYAYDPEYLDLDLFFGIRDFIFPPINNFILQAVAKHQHEFGIKFAIGKKADALNGFYYGPALRLSRTTAILWENENPVQTLSHVSQHMKSRQFGLFFGWQKEFAKVLYVDANMHILANTFSGEMQPIFGINLPTSINPTEPVLGLVDVKLGLRVADPERKSPEMSEDKRDAHLMVLSDIFALVNGRVGGEVFIPVQERSALAVKYYYRSDNFIDRGIVGPDLSFATGFESGLMWRNYFSGYSNFEGPYLETGYTYRKAHAQYTPRNRKIEHIHEAHAFSGTLGYSWNFAMLPLDIYFQQEITVTDHKLRKRVPGRDFVPGFRSRVGVRLGFEL